MASQEPKQEVVRRQVNPPRASSRHVGQFDIPITSLGFFK